MINPAEHALQATLASLAWGAIVDGQPLAEVLRAVTLTQAQLVTAAVQDGQGPSEKILAQLGADLEQFTRTMLGMAAPVPQRPQRRKA